MKSLPRTNRFTWVCLLVLGMSLPAPAAFSIAKGGKASCVILRQLRPI
jgi:hypothetical protein